MPAARATVALFFSVFAVALGLFSRHNDFPFYYHPDEPRKVSQVTQNKRNLHHPLLMLTTTDLARRAVLPGDAKKDPQRVVQVGRWVTAIFAALAAAALAALAMQIHGWAAGIAVGLLSVANPLLFELAHFFKEDPFLAASLALTCLALQRMRTLPDARGTALLGAAAALMAASKYVGFIVLPVAVFAAFATTAGPLSKGRRVAWMLGTFAVVWLGLNWWIFKSPELLWRSVGEETNKAFGGEDGAVKAVPHAYYWVVQKNYSTALLGIGLIGWLVSVVLRRIRVTMAEGVLLGVALVFFAVFSFTPKTSPRYHLPASIAVSYFAALGAIGVGKILAWRSPLISAALGLLLAAGLVVPEAIKLRERYRGFAYDDREELLEFIQANLPKDAVIAQDEAVNLPEPDRRREHEGRTPLPQRVVGKKQIADRGDLAALRAEGVTHVAICARTYYRFLQGGDSTESQFYRDVLQRGQILFSREPGMITYLQPGLTLLDITHLK